VVTRRTARAVVPARTGLDGDGLRRTDRLAQLAGDAALLAVRIAAQRMLAAESRRDRPLLERVVQSRLRLEETAHGEEAGLHGLPEKRRTCGLTESHAAAPCAPGRRVLTRRNAARSNSPDLRRSVCPARAPRAAARPDLAPTWADPPASAAT